MDPTEPSSTIPARFMCRYCDKSFSLGTNRSRHEKIHRVPKSFTKLKCNVCLCVFSSKLILAKHLAESHSEMKGMEEVKFASLNNFKDWKAQIENATSSLFVVSKTYETKAARVHVYKCHRSGYFKSRGKGLRRIKLKGSNKIGSICPANMRVCVDKNSNEVKVFYFPTHMGHDAETGRLDLLEKKIVENKKINIIQQTHKNAEEIKSEMTVLKEGENSWIISSEKQMGKMYKLKGRQLENDHKCNLVCEECKICLHAVTCSCPNNSIRSNICKHIHVLCLKEISCAVHFLCRPYENVGEEVISSSSDIYKSSKQRNLKADALEAAIGLLKDIEEFTNDEQYREVMKLITVARNKCKALISSEHKLSSFASKNSVIKKIQPQIIFPKEQKMSKTKVTIKQSNPSSTLQVFLSADPVASVATSTSMLDHQYCA